MKANTGTVADTRYIEDMSQVPTVDLVGVGLNATDTLIRLANFPVSGSKVEFDEVSILPGGQTATAIVACQSWGLQTRYVGKLGDDTAATLHHTAFDLTGVESQVLTAAGCPSAQSIILVDSIGERTVLLKRDARLALQPSELQRHWITGARALHLDGFDTAAATLAARWAKDADIPVIADLDELYPGVDDLLPLIDYLIVSRDFPEKLTGEIDLQFALKTMQRRYGCRLAAATLGPDGVLAWDGETLHYTPAYNVPVVDTTGAGDLFHAAFIFGLLQAWPLSRQLDFACAAAALNCTAPGARGGIASVDAIESLMRRGQHYPSLFAAPARTSTT